MSNFIVANLFLNIIAAAQNTEIRYQSSSTMNAVISVLVFRMYFVSGVNWGAPRLNISDIAILKIDTQRGASETFRLLKYYPV